MLAELTLAPKASITDGGCLCTCRLCKVGIHCVTGSCDRWGVQPRSEAYPPNADPGKWITCGDCDTSVPCDVNGNPYSHTCKR